MHQISFWFFQRGVTPEREITRTRNKRVSAIFPWGIHLWNFKTLACIVLDERMHARTDACIHSPKPICPVNFFKVGDINFIRFKKHKPQINPVFINQRLPTTKSSSKIVKIELELESPTTTKEAFKWLEPMEPMALPPLLARPSICCCVTKVVILSTFLWIRKCLKEKDIMMDLDPKIIQNMLMYATKKNPCDILSSTVIWATLWKKPVYAICGQQRRRSACAFMQSD